MVIGGLISVLELICTGQIYLPMIKLMVASGGPDRTLALGYLLLYNVCFVMPLAGILCAACWGVTSERLGAALRRHMAATKFVTSAFFAAVAVFLLALHHW
jgi:cytochrome b561